MGETQAVLPVKGVLCNLRRVSYCLWAHFLICAGREGTGKNLLGPLQFRHNGTTSLGCAWVDPEGLGFQGAERNDQKVQEMKVMLLKKMPTFLGPSQGKRNSSAT